MTIRHWDAPATIIGLLHEQNTTHIFIELSAPYGDGSGKAGKKAKININQLNADGGWTEISSAIEKLIHKDRKEQIMSNLEKSYDSKSLKDRKSVV
jgi:hypothetical protein